MKMCVKVFLSFMILIIIVRVYFFLPFGSIMIWSILAPLVWSSSCSLFTFLSWCQAHVVLVLVSVFVPFCFILVCFWSLCGVFRFPSCVPLPDVSYCLVTPCAYSFSLFFVVLSPLRGVSICSCFGFEGFQVWIMPLVLLLGGFLYFACDLWNKAVLCYACLRSPAIGSSLCLPHCQPWTSAFEHGINYWAICVRKRCYCVWGGKKS